MFILTTIYSASKFFTQLRKTGEIIYEIKKPRVTIKTQLFSCLFSLCYVTVVSIIFLIYVTYFANYDKLYGVFSTIVIAFLYIFLMMQGIVIGIIINERKLKNK